MALPAGRKGVLASELTPDGKIKGGGGGGGGYVLPVATSSTLGGVKPVTKTAAMTKEVGVDSEGKLYVEPSPGGGVEIGKVTLEPGVTGYITYVKAGSLCFVEGVISLIDTIAAYNEAVIGIGLPLTGTSKMTVPLSCACSMYSRATQFFLDIESNSVKLRTRGIKVDGGTYQYTFSGVYLCEVKSSTAIVFESDAISESVGTVYTSDDYACIVGNFAPKSGSASSGGVVLAQNLPVNEGTIFTAFKTDNTSYSQNENKVDVIGSDLIYATNQTSTYRVDGALLYKINKGGN